LQSCLPQHGLTRFIGRLAASRNVRVKNFLIRFFCKRYPINLTEALSADPADYNTFNDFFIRKLKPTARNIDHNQSVIISPADCNIAANGSINKNQLLQAKIITLICHLYSPTKHSAPHFMMATLQRFYLAPHHYHRVHMPLDGKLLQTIYVPGNLFLSIASPLNTFPIFTVAMNA